jgi:hypothetical protein
MPTTPSETAPHDTIGPRKRRPTERVTDNGDPLVQKKAKTASANANTSSVTATSTKSTKKSTMTSDSSLSRRASVEDVEELTPTPGPQPHHPGRILEAADGSDDDKDCVDMPPLEPIDVEDSDDEDDEENEDDDAELGMSTSSVPDQSDNKFMIARLMKRWDAPVYVFFRPTPAIVYVEGRKVHVFECAASHCKCKTRYVRRYVDTGDNSSTSNLRRHATRCWGDEAVAAADKTRTVKIAREALADKKEVDGSITAAFERAGKGKVTYSHRQHTTIEAR